MYIEPKDGIIHASEGNDDDLVSMETCSQAVNFEKTSKSLRGALDFLRVIYMRADLIWNLFFLVKNEPKRLEQEGEGGRVAERLISSRNPSWLHMGEARSSLRHISQEVEEYFSMRPLRRQRRPDMPAVDMIPWLNYFLLKTIAKLEILLNSDSIHSRSEHYLLIYDFIVDAHFLQNC